MNNRKLRNDVIRSRFGVNGLRHERALKKVQAATLVQRVHLEVVLAAILHKKGIAMWLRKRRLVSAIRKLDKKHMAVVVQRAALLDPRMAVRKVVGPGLVVRAWRVLKYRRQLRAMKKRWQRNPPKPIDGDFIKPDTLAVAS